MSKEPAQAGQILVIGASGGVGRSLTRLLLHRGYGVMGSALDQADLDEMKKAELGGAHLFIANFSNADAGAAQVRAALDQSAQPLAAVISCLGVNPAGPLETAPLDVFRRTIEINTISNLALYQTALPRLRRDNGRFIFVSSMSAKVAFPLLGHYTASKFAREGLADTMRLEAGQWGVPVVLIEPGAIATAMVHGFAAQLDRSLAQLDDQGRKNYGDYFSQQRAFSQTADTISVSPEVVADTILNALEADVPQTRYPVGSAVDLLELRRTSSDIEIDAIFNQMLPGNRTAAEVD